METRSFGRSGLNVSVLGFGCGAVGGLMVRGTEAEQERAFARAIDAGITYFDTAAIYGDGVSEQTLGKVVRRLKPRNFIYGTKVRVLSAQKSNIRAAIVASVEASLKRLGLERTDILHLHNPITKDGAGNFLTADQVIAGGDPHVRGAARPGQDRRAGPHRNRRHQRGAEGRSTAARLRARR